MKTKTLYVSLEIDLLNPGHLSYINHTLSKVRVDYNVTYNNPPKQVETDDNLTDSLFIYKENFTLKYRIK